jgi:hypothetical protein
MTTPPVRVRRRAGLRSMAPALVLAFGLPGAQRAAAQGRALILNEDIRPELTEAATELTAIMAAQGVAADVVLLPSGDPGDMAAYQCVFDLRVDFALDPVVEGRLADHAMRGGGIYLAGEHAAFAFRNDTLAAFLSSLGGGVIQASPVGVPGLGPMDIIEPTNPAHPLSSDCNEITEIDYDGILNGQWIAFGNGTWISGDPLVGACTIAFDEGTLTAAPDARAVATLDINYLATGPAGTLDFRIDDRNVRTQNRPYVENLVQYLCVPAASCGGCTPRDHGYWHRACLGTDTIDPGRNGHGNGPPPIADFANFPPYLLARVNAAMAPYGLTGCQALDEGSFSDPRLAALRELATLQFNKAAGWLASTCPVELHPVVDDEGLTVRDAIRLIQERLADGSDEALREARWIGEHVANGEALIR